MNKGVSGFFVVSLSLLFFVVLTEGTQKNGVVKKDEFLRRGETRQTIDPGLFQDERIRRAYQVAKEIPWVIDSIYCYCKCEESPVFRHKSLLSCYVDNHAAM